jgi:hypothetical protein
LRNRSETVQRWFHCYSTGRVANLFIELMAHFTLKKLGLFTVGLVPVTFAAYSLGVATADK